MPNTKHISGGSQVVGLAPLISAFVKNLQLPNISWTIQEDGTIFAQTDARNPPVQRVKLWQASSCDAHRMDWRQLSAKAEVCPCGQATSQGCENWVQWNSYDLPHHSFWRVRPNISADGRWTAFFLSFECLWIDLCLLTVSFMQLERQLALTPDKLGVILMARGLASSLSGVLWGSLADKSDRTATPSLASLRGLLVTQMLSGLFASAVAPVSQSLVSENVQEGLIGMAFSVLAMCAGFAGSASAFLYSIFTWQSAYRMMGSMTLTTRS
eukprot:g13577.t1